MFVLTQVSIPDVFLIFFLTLGPLKALGPFAQATRGADQASRRRVARRATAIATGIVIAVALFSSVVLEQWRVSVAALVVSGSIIIFCQSLHMIIEPPVPAPPPHEPQGAEPAPLSLALAYCPVAVPALVTAPGIAALVVFMAIAGGDCRQTGIVLGVLLVIMALNLVTLLKAEAIRRAPPPVLRVVGWVMAVVQAVGAVQYLFNGLVRVGVLHTPSVPEDRLWS